MLLSNWLQPDPPLRRSLRAPSKTLTPEAPQQAPGGQRLAIQPGGLTWNRRSRRSARHQQITTRPDQRAYYASRSTRSKRHWLSYLSLQRDGRREQPHRHGGHPAPRQPAVQTSVTRRSECRRPLSQRRSRRGLGSLGSPGITSTSYRWRETQVSRRYGVILDRRTLVNGSQAKRPKVTRQSRGVDNVHVAACTTALHALPRPRLRAMSLRSYVDAGDSR